MKCRRPSLRRRIGLRKANQNHCQWQHTRYHLSISPSLRPRFIPARTRRPQPSPGPRRVVLLILERMRAQALQTVRHPHIHRFPRLIQRTNRSGIRPSHRPVPVFHLCLHPCRVRLAFLR
jgi:hypothetical protein